MPPIIEFLVYNPLPCEKAQAFGDARAGQATLARCERGEGSPKKRSAMRAERFPKRTTAPIALKPTG